MPTEKLSTQTAQDSSDPFGWNQAELDPNSNPKSTNTTPNHNYDYPEIISNYEADRLIGQAPPRTGLYQNLNEIIDHSPEQLGDFLLHFQFDISPLLEDPENFQSDLTETYAAITAYLDLGELYNKSIILAGAQKAHDRRSTDYHQPTFYGIDPQAIATLPEKYTPKTESIPLSSILHLIHQANPTIREEAIEAESKLKAKLAQEAGIDLNLIREVYLPQPDKVTLTGKDGVPAYLRALVEEKLKSIRDDLKVDYRVTWDNSHLDNGVDYDYSIPETPYVQIFATNEESANLAEKALNTITQEEANQKQREFENQGIGVLD